MNMDARIKWTVIAVMYGLIALFLNANGIAFDWSAMTRFILPFLILVTIYAVYSGPRPNPQFASLSMSLLLVCFFSPGVVLLSYAAASFGYPYIDDELIRIDAAIGFDWLTVLVWVNDRPALGKVLHYAYQSPLFQTLLIVLPLPFLGHAAHVERWFLAFMICALVCVLLSGPLPAVAAYVHMDVPPALYANLTPTASHVHIDVLTALREGTITSVTFERLEGIVTFPSFHAAMCLLYAYGMRPVRYLFVFGCVLNGLMLVSCITEGGHYLIDIIAGSLIAALSITAAVWLHGRYSAAPSTAAEPALEPQPAERTGT